METRLSEKQPKVGEFVIFFDQFGMEHNALLTAVWGDKTISSWKEEGSDVLSTRVDNPCVNLLIVSPDEKRDDSYGRQIERMTSVVHSCGQSAWGNFYCELDQIEEAREKCMKAKFKEFGDS